MQHHTVQQITSGPAAGRWVFTGGNRREGRYIECCRDEHGQLLPDDQLGHDTRDEAYAHMRQVLLARVDLDGTSPQWNGCAVCDVATKRYASIAPMHYLEPLCDTHRTREVVNGRFTVGDWFGSY